jgi:hypothetical protein
MRGRELFDALEAGREAALRGEWPAAAAAYRRALALRPDPTTRHALAVSLLGAGNYVEGFRLYGFRHTVPYLRIPRPRLDAPEWTDEPLAGKHIVLFHEQGLGDEIMFARFAPLLRERGADVTLFCNPALARLFSCLGVRVIAASGAVDFPEPDYWALIGDLPQRLGVTVESVPGAPYLAVDGQPGGGVGVIRRGNPHHPNDANRSLPESVRIPFPALSLDPADTGATDFFETAQIVAGLDTVVTVDTSVAHLAGAMGKPCFILLPAIGCDWRWMSGATSPWYPSARLVRQETPGDWDEPLARISPLVGR